VPTLDGQVRLDTVAHRRDRFFVAAAPALFTLLVVVMLWPLVLAVCWGLFDAPWLSLAPGVAGTVAVVRWGSRLTRVSRSEARAVPHLVVTADGLEVWHARDAGPARIPLSAIRVVTIDQPAGRQRRADRVRFPVGGTDGRPVGWLYCRDKAALPTISFGFEKTPNLAVVFSRPTRIGAGLLAAVTDPAAARATFAGRVPVRPIEEADLGGVCSPTALPVRRHGRYGLREVRSEDRVRARIFDAFAIEVLFFLLAAWLAPPPGHNQLPAVVSAFVLAWFLYEVPLTALIGQTPGKLLLGLRVVPVEDGSARIGLGRATARSLLRFLNGLAGPFNNLAEGDALGRVAPRLSLINGVGAGTLVVTDGEYRRLRSEMSAAEREQALTTTLLEIEALEPTASPRAGISLLFALLLGVGLVVGLIRQGPGDGAPQLDTPRPAVVATPSPDPLLPTAAAPVLPSLPGPSFDIPLPSFDWDGAVGN
jgi:hypothetical protein